MIRAHEQLTMYWLFSGFLQQEGAVTNGMVALGEQLHADLLCRTNRIFPRTYRDNVKAAAAHAEMVRQAQQIYRNQLTLNVVGYSYGCDTAVRFCDALAEVGLHASRVILCDPVKRFRPYAILYRPLRRAVDYLGLRPTLKVGSNAHQVQVFAQDVARPWPCRVFHGDAEVRPVYLPYAHTAMDNAPEFREAVLSLARPWRPRPELV